jgi:hypothetical protein
MKSLNDNLKDEFKEMLKNPIISNLIETKNLDQRIIHIAFEKLLAHKMGDDEIELIKKGRSEFEMYIINDLKTKKH